MSTKKTQPLSEDEVKRCFKRKTLEDKFQDHSMSIHQRMNLLLQVMGNPAISYSSGFPNEKIRYEIILDTFLSGIWREKFDK